MKQAKTLDELLAEIVRMDEQKQDYVVSESSTRMLSSGEIQIRLGNNSRELKPTETFENQLAEALGIPKRYYSKMKEESPDLLVNNVNHWLERGVRSHVVRELDGYGRAFLSANYRSIDNYEVAETVIPMILNTEGVHVASCEVTSERLFIKAVNERVSGEVKKGDIVQAGFFVGNNEVGFGALTIQPMIYRLACENGMITGERFYKGFSRRHVGGRLEEAWDVFSDDTKRLSNTAILSQVADIVSTLGDPARFSKLVEIMQNASDWQITSDVVELVGKVQKDYMLSKEENSGVLQHLLREGELSLYGLANAITRTAQDVSSYTRSTELEVLGFELLSMSSLKWGALNARAA